MIKIYSSENIKENGRSSISLQYRYKLLSFILSVVVGFSLKIQLLVYHSSLKKCSSGFERTHIALTLGFRYLYTVRILYYNHTYSMVYLPVCGKYVPEPTVDKWKLQMVTNSTQIVIFLCIYCYDKALSGTENN